MPEACTGGAGAMGGEGWDIALIRVTQLCPNQRCVPPLDLSTDALDEGAKLTLAGAARRGQDEIDGQTRFELQLGNHAPPVCRATVQPHEDARLRRVRVLRRVEARGVVLVHVQRRVKQTDVDDEKCV